MRTGMVFLGLAVVGCSTVVRLGLERADVEPWPEGVEVVAEIEVIEGPGEGEGPERESLVLVLDGSGGNLAGEALAGTVSRHLRTKGWVTSATFEDWPSFVGTSDSESAVVLIGTWEALAVDQTPLNPAGKEALLANGITGEGLVVIEFAAASRSHGQ